MGDLAFARAEPALAEIAKQKVKRRRLAGL